MKFLTMIFLLVSILILPSTILNPLVHAGINCDFPAIINFGDSNSDTGGFAASYNFPPNPPYGDTYFHKPAGRYSDGRLLIDFIAEAFGLPFLHSYLDSLGANFSHGINFAELSSTIRLPDAIMPKGGYNPFYLDIQYSQFVQFKNRSQMIRKQGNLFSSLMPKEEYFAKALYTIDMGQNDLGEGFSSNLTMVQVKASVPDMVGNFSANIKNLYGLGARSFWIHNTGPIGCLPYILTAFPTGEKDSVGCLKPHNEVAQYFNLKLKEVVVQLRNEFPSAAFTYVDVYPVKYSLFAEPEKHGFEVPLVSCCGYGGPYGYSNIGVLCGRTITVNGTNIFVGSCERPSARVVWDGIHYTEAANKFIFDKISTGSYSDPPVPLKHACQRNF